MAQVCDETRLSIVKNSFDGRKEMEKTKDRPTDASEREKIERNDRCMYILSKARIIFSPEYHKSQYGSSPFCCAQGLHPIWLFPFRIFFSTRPFFSFLISIYSSLTCAMATYSELVSSYLLRHSK